jgi:DNA-binding NarL/FixJ family response regulator
MTNVMIVDDHPIVRRGLRETLAVVPDIKVVAEASRSEEVMDALAAHRCDVVLLDLSLPGRGGLDVLKDIQRDSPQVRVLVVSTYSETQYALRAIRAGAAGYLVKTSAPEELVRAVRSVMDSGRYITEGVAAALADYARENVRRAAHDHLSDREHEVFRLLVTGLTISQIAEHLSLSVKTISTYRRRLGDKLRLHSTADLVRYAVELRLFE